MSHATALTRLHPDLARRWKPRKATPRPARRYPVETVPIFTNERILRGFVARLICHALADLQEFERVRLKPYARDFKNARIKVDAEDAYAWIMGDGVKGGKMSVISFMECVEILGEDPGRARRKILGEVTAAGSFMEPAIPGSSSVVCP